MTADDEKLHAERLAQFEILYQGAETLMAEYGRPYSSSGPGDFSIWGDYWGYPQVKISVHELALLHPRIVKRLQELLADFPEWEFVVTVAVRGHYDDWPDMGLYVRRDEIIDTLQRQYFPSEFQGLAYEGSRRGVEGEVGRGAT